MKLSQMTFNNTKFSIMIFRRVACSITPHNSIQHNSISVTKFSIITFSITVFSITTFNFRTFSTMRFSIKTFSITTFCITPVTLSITSNNATPSIITLYADCCFAACRSWCVLLFNCYGEYHYADCVYAGCKYAECRGPFIFQKKHFQFLLIFCRNKLQRLLLPNIMCQALYL
jgi:hypothetical protein